MTTLAYVALHDRMADAIDAELGAAIAGLGADGESVRDAVGVWATVEINFRLL